MDGVATAEEYAKTALKHGMPALAVTDHGTLSNHRHFGRVMREHGIKPIFGVEAYITSDIKDRRPRKDRHEPLDKLYHHLTILAKNEVGYANLLKLNEISWAEGYYFKPRIDFDLLGKYSEGLVLGSACMGGLLNQAIEHGDFSAADKYMSTLKDIGGEDFYVEVMPHNDGIFAGMNDALYELANKHGVKAITTPDCHHADVSQKVIQEIALISATKPKKLSEAEVAEQYAKLEEENSLPDYSMLPPEDVATLTLFDNLYGPDRMTFNKFDIHLLSPEEMREGMGNAFRPEFFENTREVNDKIEDIVLPEGLSTLPDMGADPLEILRVKCEESLDKLPQASPQYYDRLKEELRVVDVKGFAPYFLVVEDMVSWAKDKGIMVGPGRGSGAGSLINYLLGITRVDPVEYKLLFSRFIDESRPDWPDIDVDFQDNRRDEVKDYIAERYGNVGAIATYQYFRDKGMLKDIARTMEIPLADVNKAAKLFETWEEYKVSPSLAWFRNQYPLIEKYGDQLRGRTRGTGVHASGVVASKMPLAEIIPVETRAPGGGKRIPVVAFDMDESADIGLIKLDILGLKALTVISETLRLIKERHGKDIDLYAIDYDDPDVFRMLNMGYTASVFQCEQSPFTRLLVSSGVDNLDELIAANALVRPGAARTIGPDYIARKSGKQEVEFVHDVLRPFLEETYGLPVFQENVMQICVHLAGMTEVEANAVRKITSKKKDPVALEKYRGKFVQGASLKVARNVAEGLWEDILEWSGYGFPKAHATAYGFLSYQMAWLKLYYPLEFMVSSLNSEGDKNSRTEYLIEAKLRMGINILLPHINKSDVGFSIEDGAIRMGLSSVKYVSELIAGRYIKQRPFGSYADVKEFSFTKGSGVNSRALEHMDMVGAVAFDDNISDRRKVIDNLFEVLNLPEVLTAVPPKWHAKIDAMQEFEETGVYIVTGVVTGVRRGPGWSLVSAMDKTGAATFFDTEDTTVVKDRHYVFLLRDNRVVDALPVSEIGGNETRLEKWFKIDLPICAEGELHVIAFDKRRTKAGKVMGDMVVSTSDGRLKSMVVFPSNFGVAYTGIEEGRSYRMKHNTKENGWVFKSVE